MCAGWTVLFSAPPFTEKLVPTCNVQVNTAYGRRSWINLTTVVPPPKLELPMAHLFRSVIDGPVRCRAISRTVIEKNEGRVWGLTIR